MSAPRQVRKRDGRLVPFERSKIADAIFRAAQAVGGEDRFRAEQLAGLVETLLGARSAPGSEGPPGGRVRRPGWIPGIEDVQDAVEKVLIETGHARTAKAYILYREQRARVRARREAVGGLPLVGGGPEGELEPFSKGALAEALMAADDLSRPEAEEVARAVEARLLASKLPRVGAGLVEALVRAELFARGRDSRLGRVERVALERKQVVEALASWHGECRARSPQEAVQGLGEALVAEHVLTAVLPPAAAEAHRLGDLHVYDLGAPLALTAVTLPAPRVLQRHLWGEHTSRAYAARRAVTALRRAVAVSTPFAARTLALEDVNVLLAPFVGGLDDEALREELRELLLAPELAVFPARGGLLQLELGLAAEVPMRLRPMAPPPPAPPGATYADLADQALRVARLLLREHLALRRQGRSVGPLLTLVLPRGAAREPALRALVREALGSAAHAGEPVLVFEHAGSPSRGCRWLRLEEAESPDPLRFDSGDVSVASAVAVNLAGAASRARGDLADTLTGLERLAVLAVEALAARRELLRGPAAEPGGALWPLARGEHPLVDLEGAWHVLEPVGLTRAAELLLPKGPAEERAALRQRLLAHLQRVAQEAADRRGLPLQLVESPTAEAALRCARLDALRLPEALAWWGDDEQPSYRPAAPGVPGVRREPAWARRQRGSAWSERVRHQVDPERRPPVDDLLRSLEAAERDLAVVEYAVDPWPRRRIVGADEPA